MERLVTHTKKKEKGRITALLWKIAVRKRWSRRAAERTEQELTEGHKKMLMENRVKSRYEILILK